MRLDQDVEHVAVLVDRAPQVMSGAVDLHEHLVKVPLIGDLFISARLTRLIAGSARRSTYRC